MAVGTRPREGALRADPRPLRFLRDAFDELRKVVWPTPPELYRYTLVVIVTVLVIAGFISLVDLGVSEFVRRFVYHVPTTK
jgi:preprotein translocase subunit SecE